MAQLPSAFNSSDHQDMNDFTPIPDGDYICQIVKSEMKQTKAKDGHYLELVFEVLQGEHKGKKLWERLNLLNKSPQAVEIAQKELATICRAAKIPVVSDSNQLHGILMLVSAKIKPATSTQPAGNLITFFKPLNANPAGGEGGGGNFDDGDGKPAADAPAAESEKTEEQATTSKPWD